MKLNQTEFAEFIGKSDQHVALLVQQGLPAVRSGKRGQRVSIDCPAAVDWLMAREFQKGQADGAPAGSLDGETRRLRSAQAEIAELEAAELSGRVAPVEDFEVATNEAMVAIRTNLEAVSSRCAAQLAAMTDAGEIRIYLLNEIRRALDASADRLEGMFHVAQGRETPSASAQPNA